MYTKLTRVADTSPYDEFRHQCSFDECAARTERGPWTYFVTKVRADFPNHAEQRHVDAETAWAEHVAEYHGEHRAQHHKRPEANT